MAATTELVLHTDLPTTNDRLDWGGEVERIAARVKNCAVPHVLGIHGEWGSGKTSFMRQVQRALGGDFPDDASVDTHTNPLPERKKKTLQKEVVTIWFDAWRYQNEAVPVVALLNEMRAQLSLVPSVVTRLEKLGSILAYSVLDNLSGVAKIIGAEGVVGVDKIEKRAEQWEKDNFSTQSSATSIRNHLCKTIECLLPTKTSRAVIFIDDLDRCNPKSAIRLLEGLKIYLSIPKCIFVLGMNERILVDAIRDEISTPTSSQVVGSSDDAKHRASQLRAAHYLEKICSDIYRLPFPESSALLFSTWLYDVEQKFALLEAIGNTVCLPPNPRRLKALSNQWDRFAKKIPFPIENLAAQQIWAVRVLVVSYIHQFHRDIWERWHFTPDFWQEILSYCIGESGIEKPAWSMTLTMSHAIQGYDEQTSQPILKDLFPNPGDIDNFWIGSLIRKYSDQLLSNDFKPLL